MRYTWASSSDFLEFYPGNVAAQFIIELPGTFYDVNRIALIEFGCEGLYEPVYILCDVLQRSLVHDRLQPVLCYISSSAAAGAVQNPIFVDTIRSSFQRMRFSIVTKNFEEAPGLFNAHLTLALDREL